ncbi:sensor histidine kinase [Plebeiibacterium marinum]|uniref:Sensor histidine kinase n=1 Tax=Plebeiibacterium marinum TaxID=2992111 RepID=A0AAE3MBR8_9BACT|nr:sensor histidine kinase [Plebeiobacterium marinum]MCW3804541.1 sensor histidine kinase [Plebeiobacterium marinum]
MIYFFSTALKAFVIGGYNVLCLGLIYYAVVYYFFPKYYHQKNKYFLISFGYIVLITTIVVAGEYLSFEFFHEEGKELPPVAFLFMRLFMQFYLAFFAATSVSLMEQTTQLKENEKLLNEEKLKTELKLLKAQINPHFIFNALNNIYSLTYMQKQNAPESVLKLSEMLRYVFYDCNKDKVKLLQEIKYIENFMAFQQMKSEHVQNIQFNMGANIDSIEVAPMLFIPFIENAFKYSKIEEVEDAYVHIDIKHVHNELFFSIENSVPVTGKSIAGSGLGIKNVKHRLDIIYQDQYHLQINNNDQEYKVELVLEV